MIIKIKKLVEGAVIPQYSKQGDAGLDLTATSLRMDPTGFIEYGTGLAVQIPTGYVGLVFPRSSISRVKMQLCNAVGVIDSGYRGEILCRFKPSTVGKGSYNVGERIAQLVILPYPDIKFIEYEELEDTVRGATGFGSTGRTDHELDMVRTHINEGGLVEKYTLREQLNGKEIT